MSEDLGSSPVGHALTNSFCAALPEPRHPICPECLENLDTLPVGLDWRCPGCGLVFTVEQPEPRTYTVSAVRRHRPKQPSPQIEGPADLYRLLKPLLAHQDREHFYAVLLSTKNHVLAVELVSVGSLSASLVHPREVFKPAILRSAAAIVVAHNHPSNLPDPSPEDVEFTRRLVRAGELLGIRVLDHLIVCEGEYVSLRDEGHFSQCKEDGCQGS